MHHRDMKGAMVVAMSLLMLAGCASSNGSGEASCALALQYQGRTYYGLKAAKPVTGGEPLAEVRFSPCDDSGGQVEPGTAEEEDAAARFQALTLKGIDPTVAFVVPSRWPSYIFFSGPGNATTFPPKIKRLLNP
jgi:Family of unknown function (DUF6281)